MRYPLNVSLFLLISGLLLTSCHEKNNTPESTREGYVIGFDPCTPEGNRGFVLAFPNLPDTVVTYTLPQDIYPFPPALFQQYQFYFLFPLSEQKKYKVRVSYYPTPKDKRTYSFCLANINLGHFNRIVKDQQITITAAQRVN